MSFDAEGKPTLYRELVQAAYATADRTGCEVEATPEWRAAALLPDGDQDSQFARLGLHKRKHLSNVGKHKCRNDAHLRGLIDRLDQQGECVAADTIAGLIWNIDLANMRYERDIGSLARTALR